MNITRDNPFWQMRSLQNDINRLFSTNLDPSWDDQSLGRGSWNPQANIYETKDKLMLEFELPGIDKDDIQLSFENNVLTVSGERRAEQSSEEKNYHRLERLYASFTRSFTLPNTVSSEWITADYRNGVLYISLPKREEVKAHRIQVTGDSTTAEAPVTIEAQAEGGHSENEKRMGAKAGK